MNNKSIIVWEKWYSPFGEDDENVIDQDLESLIEEELEDDLDSAFEPDQESEQENKIAISKHLFSQKFMITPMGVMPITENTDSSRIFNFWTGHTNFNISKTIASIIESCDGVESLDVFTRYRFRISVGKVFKESEVMSNINKTIYEIL